MVKLKKGEVFKICRACKKKKAMHKHRVTCSRACAKKYSNNRQMYFFKKRGRKK